MFKKISSFWEMIFGPSKETDEVRLKPREQKKKGFTPTYLIIAEDLNNKEQKVFEAAVYDLCVIAKSKQEYQKDILDILSSCLTKFQNQPARLSYIKEMMSAHGLDETIHNQ